MSARRSRLVNPISITMLRIAALDLCLSAAFGLIWVGPVAVSDGGLVTTLLAIRLFASLLYLARLLEPMRTFLEAGANGRALDDATLLDVDAKLARILPRLSIAMGLGWIVALSLSVALSTLGIPVHHTVARAELMTAALMAMVVIIAAPTMLFGPLRASLQGIEVEVGRALLARELTSERRQTSLSRIIRARHMATILALTLAGGAITGLVRVHERRAEAVSAQLHLALRSTVSGAETPGVRVVDRGELPAVLGPSPEHRIGESLTAFDPEHEQVVAAIARTDGRWALAVATPDEKLGRVLAYVLGICGILLGMGFIGGQAMGRAVVEPLTELDAKARELLERGELGRIDRITCPQNDEVGALASTFNQILEAFMQLAIAAKSIADGDLRVEIDQPGDLPDAFRTMLHHLREMVGRLRETSTELSGVAAELLSSTEAHQLTTEQQSSSVSSISALMEAVAESATRITTSARDVRQNAEQSLTTTETTVARINELERHVGGIRELLVLIREIADRSDLLALNGSLEAVRAGEVGRGFGLVAGEMRRLAERVSGAVEDIRSQVAGIEDSTGKTVEASERNRELATSTAEAARAIDSAAHEQAMTTADAVAGIDQAHHGVRALVEASARARATAEGLRAHARRLELLTGEFRI